MISCVCFALMWQRRMMRCWIRCWTWQRSLRRLAYPTS
nr:MAG TPA: hypothetical protein [Caudoviricetes sp.]DAR26188.1 MAG TPA: hypothetical protein [Caudoviricetes sp.]